jgi:hypothetical protein
MHFTFESTTCGRCGGTGHLPFAVYGGKCFACHGDKVVMTRAGKAARRKWDAWREATLAIKVADLAPGMLAKPADYHVGFTGVIRFRRSLLVLEVTHGVPSGASHIIDGVAVPILHTEVVFQYRAKASESLAPVQDVEAGTLRMRYSPSTVLYRSPTREELLSLDGKLGKGATLIDEPAAVAPAPSPTGGG